MQHTRDRSTYSAIFAVIFIVLLILIGAYHSGQKLFSEWRETKTRYPSDNTTQLENPVKETLFPEGKVLYSNLTDEEADRIIQNLLQVENTSEEEVNNLESSLIQ